MFSEVVTGFYKRAAICTYELNAVLIFKDIVGKGKMTAPAPWAAAEPETIGKGL